MYTDFGRRIATEPTARLLERGAPIYCRFVQADPLGYEDSPNLYAYVGNDPANYTDPRGLSGLCAGQRADVCGRRLRGLTLEGRGDLANDLLRGMNTQIVQRPTEAAPFADSEGDEITVIGERLKNQNLSPAPITIASNSTVTICLGPPKYPIPEGFESADQARNRYIRPKGSNPANPPTMNPTYKRDVSEQRSNYNWSGVYWDIANIVLSSITGGLGGGAMNAARLVDQALAGAAAGTAGTAAGAELSDASSC